MRLAVLLALGAWNLTGCAPPHPRVTPQFRLDCDQGYDALARQIATLPGIQLARAPGEPYHYFNSEDGQTSYVLTLPGGAGHPAIIQQRSTKQGMADVGCAFGDKAGYNLLLTYLKSLAGARQR